MAIGLAALYPATGGVHRQVPELAADEDFRQFFLALHKVRGLSRSTATVAIAAFKFLFEVTLQRPWPRLDLFRPRPIQSLPVILSVEEVWRILDHVHRPTYYACLATIYTCGLRISEGVNLQVRWIDSARMQLQVRGGKGLKDRYIPLPPRTLTLLRQQWLTHRNPIWLFSAGRRVVVKGVLRVARFLRVPVSRKLMLGGRDGQAPV